MMLLDHAPGSFGDYAAAGGGKGLERALGLGPEQVIDEVARSGLRGRGGAGFPTGKKWSSVRQAGPSADFVCNAAEGEPATFKDRLLMRRNPYQVVEGLAIATYAVGARRGVLGLKDVFEPEAAALARAIDEMHASGALAETPVELAFGPDHFLTGEETGLLQAVAGREPLPTDVPTFVRGAGAGAGEGPTPVNNVETLANVPHILTGGGDWLRQWGTERSPGTVVFTLAGDIEREGCYELPLGTPLGELINEHAGGVAGGRDVKVVIPGASHHVLTPERLDTPLDYESMSAAGSGLGAGGFAVFADTACVVRVAYLYARFLYVESCGQCPPCKQGTGAITEQLEAIERGREEGKGAADAVLRRLETIQDGRKCELPTGARHIVESLLRLFPGEFDAHAGQPCPSEREIAFPKLEDLDEGAGRFTYDDRYYLKQPDWTYTQG